MMRILALAALALITRGEALHAAAGDPPRLFIRDFEVVGGDPEEDRWLSDLVTESLGYEMRKLHSCAKVLTASDARALLRIEKEAQLFGVGQEGFLEGNFAKNVNARYVVTGKIVKLGEHYEGFATLMDTRTATVKERVHARVDPSRKRFPESVAKKLNDAIPKCDLSLDLTQNYSGSNVVGQLSGVIPLEINGDGDVTGEGTIEGVLVPLNVPDEVARKAVVRLRSDVVVEGRRNEDNVLVLRIRGKTTKLDAGGRSISAGGGSGSYDARILARVGESELIRPQSYGGYMITTYLDILYRGDRPR